MLRILETRTIRFLKLFILFFWSGVSRVRARDTFLCNTVASPLGFAKENSRTACYLLVMKHGQRKTYRPHFPALDNKELTWQQDYSPLCEERTPWKEQISGDV